MYEEDRIRVLEQYEAIFEESGNENAVLQLLVSPTRQAVNLARAYDDKERRSLSSSGELPGYLAVIDELRRQVGTLVPPASSVNDDQISLFEEPDVADTVFDNIKNIKNIQFDMLPADAENEAENTVPEEIGRFPDEDPGAGAAVRPMPEPAPPMDDRPNQDVDQFSDAVEAFLADFTIRSDGTENTPPLYQEQAPDDRQEEPPVRAPLIMPAAGAHDEDAPLPAEKKAPTASRLPDVKPVFHEEPVIREKKPNMPLLILYILLAVPITLLLVMLLLVPAALCLGLGATGLGLGFAGVIEAFSFSVFADILVVFGLSLATAAIGLLLFWCFVRLLFSGIPGLIRGACSLARKLCYKEVAA